MTVAELIESLKALPQNYTVAVDLNSEDTGSYSDFEVNWAGDGSTGVVYFTPDDLAGVKS